MFPKTHSDARRREGHPASSTRLEHVERRVDLGDRRRAVPVHDLTERTREVRTDGAGWEDVLREDDAAHHVGGAEAAVGGDLVAPLTDLDPLRFRSEQPPSLRRENNSGYRTE